MQVLTSSSTWLVERPSLCCVQQSWLLTRYSSECFINPITRGGWPNSPPPPLPNPTPPSLSIRAANTDFGMGVGPLEWGSPPHPIFRSPEDTYIFTPDYLRMERMKDREVLVTYPACYLSPSDRVLAKQKYDRAERAETIPIGNQMLFSNYVTTQG